MLIALSWVTIILSSFLCGLTIAILKNAPNKPSIGWNIVAISCAGMFVYIAVHSYDHFHGNHLYNLLIVLTPLGLTATTIGGLLILYGEIKDDNV